MLLDRILHCDTSHILELSLSKFEQHLQSLVPESSVAAGKYIFQNQVKHYTTMTVTGADAQHSSLPQNKQVVQLIEQYLLESTSGDNTQGNGQRPRGSRKKQDQKLNN